MMGSTISHDKILENLPPSSVRSRTSAKQTVDKSAAGEWALSTKPGT
jgi:hypothetical protein